MGIKTYICCDGPACHKRVEGREREWPSDFIVILVYQSRDGVGPTGEVGFCSLDCFKNWAQCK